MEKGKVCINVEGSGKLFGHQLPIRGAIVDYTFYMFLLDMGYAVSIYEPTETQKQEAIKVSESVAESDSESPAAVVEPESEKVEVEDTAKIISEPVNIAEEKVESASISENMATTEKHIPGSAEKEFDPDCKSNIKTTLNVPDHGYTKDIYYCVFCPRYRKHVFDIPGFTERFLEVFKKELENNRMEYIEGVFDHDHAVVVIHDHRFRDPRNPTTTRLNHVKRKTTFIKDEFLLLQRIPNLWTKNNLISEHFITDKEIIDYVNIQKSRY